MKEAKRYSLIKKNGTIAYLGVTQKEIDQIFGKRVNVSYYLENDILYKMKYRIEPYEGTRSELFIHNWNKTCKLFKNVEWVKTGGKRLHLYED